MNIRTKNRKVYQRKPSIDYITYLNDLKNLDDYGNPKKKPEESDTDLFSDFDYGVEEPPVDFWTDLDWE